MLRLTSFAMLVRASVSTCSVTQELGCFADSNVHRLLPHDAVFASKPAAGKLTRELCAEYCCADGWSDPTGYPPPGSAVVGVEYGAQYRARVANSTCKLLDLRLAAIPTHAPPPRRCTARV